MGPLSGIVLMTHRTILPVCVCVCVVVVVVVCHVSHEVPASGK